MRRPGSVTLIRFLSPLIVILLFFMLMLPHVHAQPGMQGRPWMNASQAPDQRAAALLAQMRWLSWLPRRSQYC